MTQKSFQKQKQSPLFGAVVLAVATQTVCLSLFQAGPLHCMLCFYLIITGCNGHCERTAGFQLMGHVGGWRAPGRQPESVVFEEDTGCGWNFPEALLELTIDRRLCAHQQRFSLSPGCSPEKMEFLTPCSSTDRHSHGAHRCMASISPGGRTCLACSPWLPFLFPQRGMSTKLPRALCDCQKQGVKGSPCSRDTSLLKGILVDD